MEKSMNQSIDIVTQYELTFSSCDKLERWMKKWHNVFLLLSQMQIFVPLLFKSNIFIEATRKSVARGYNSLFARNGRKIRLQGTFFLPKTTTLIIIDTPWFEIVSQGYWTWKVDVVGFRKKKQSEAGHQQYNAHLFSNWKHPLFTFKRLPQLLNITEYNWNQSRRCGSGKKVASWQLFIIFCSAWRMFAPYVVIMLTYKRNNFYAQTLFVYLYTTRKPVSPRALVLGSRTLGLPLATVNHSPLTPTFTGTWKPTSTSTLTFTLTPTPTPTLPLSLTSTLNHSDEKSNGTVRWGRRCGGGGNLNAGTAY